MIEIWGWIIDGIIMTIGAIATIGLLAWATIEVWIQIMSRSKIGRDIHRFIREDNEGFMLYMAERKRKRKESA